MQKLKRNFVESKMNKDLDDRFVPPGEYRDALNISVITNTDSSSGAVQNSLGNESISDLSSNIEGRNTVNGAVSSSSTVVFHDANYDLRVGTYLYNSNMSSQPVIIDVSSDKKTVELNTLITLADNDVVFSQYPKMLPNQCVGSIEDEGEGSIYWMTSSIDDDDGRKFNFRNAQQRSNVNIVPNPNFQQGTASNYFADGWDHETAEENLVITHTGNSDNFITLEHKAGNTVAYPGFSPKLHMKFEHGKRYKVSFKIDSVSSTNTSSSAYNPKVFLYGVTDPETGAQGVNSYRPVYTGNKGLPPVGDNEYYFIFDENKNNKKLFDNPGSLEKTTESSYYLSLRIELSQGTGGYQNTSYEQLIKIGEFSITEHDADLAVYQDAIFKYSDDKTDIIANDIYMIEAPHTAPHFTSSSNIATSASTFIHEAVTKDMSWQIVSVNDVSGVPHQPHNAVTHGGIVSSVKSAELGLDPSFDDATWNTNDNTNAVGWPTNNTGVSGNGAGAIYWEGGSLHFNAVADDKYIGGGNVNILTGKTYITKIKVTSLTAGKIRVIFYDGNKKFWASPNITTDGLYEYEFIGGSGSAGSFDSSVVIQSQEAGTTAVIAAVQISDKFDLSVATLEPYSGSAVEFPASPSDYKIVFVKPKVLNFNYNAKITGINIVEKMLFWTDGYSEPKKINTKNFSLGTQSLYSQSRLHTNQNNSILDKNLLAGSYNGANSIDSQARTVSFWQPYFGHSDSTDKIKAEHVTVIRTAPHQPPLLDLSNNESTKKNSFTKTFDLNRYGQGGGPNENNKVLIVGQSIWIGNVSENSVDTSIVAGDLLYASQGVDNSFNTGYDLKFQVEYWYSTNDIKLKVLYINPEKTYEDVHQYFFTKGRDNGIYEDKFVRFGYRYQYSDNEYSSFSPFSRPAFLPNQYKYDAIDGVNYGMINKAKSVVIKGWVPQDVPADVVGVDLLYKESNNTNIYKLKSFHKDSSEWNTIAYGDSSSKDDAHLAHHGVYSFNSENIMGALPSSQLLRSWDAVPKKAVAQEVVGNRLVYANYTQNYDISSGGTPIDFSMSANMLNATSLTNTSSQYSDGRQPLTSCKSLRSYQVGVVYGDKFGRETPILTSGNCAVEPSATPSTGRLLLQAQITSPAPSWASYYRHYVKQSSLPYHNLVLDRWWEAEDDTLWLSFYSHDRNKLEEGDELILKKKHGGDYVLPSVEKNKILAIENEAPDSCKLKTIKIATYNADSVAILEADGASTPYGNNGAFTEHGFLGETTGNSLPQYPRSGDVNQGEDYFDIKDTAWESSGFTGLEKSFAMLGPNETLSIMFRRYGISSEKYEVLNIQAPSIDGNNNPSSLFADRYRVTLDRPIGADAADIVRVGRYLTETTTTGGVTTTTYVGLTVYAGVLIQAFVDTYELEDYHEGRFFVKVNKTNSIRNYVMCNGRSVEQREVMEMRLPYLAHNANFWSTGETGMSTTSPLQTPHASSVGTKSYVSAKVKRSLIGSGLANGTLANVTDGRKVLLTTKYETGTGNNIADLTYADIDSGVPYSHYSYTNSGYDTTTTTDTVSGGMHRSNLEWEDYFVRYSTSNNASGLEDDFWFVDKESEESTFIYHYQKSTSDPGLGSQLTNWTPLYRASDGTTTATHASGLWTNTGSAETPGPANNWTDNNPARFLRPTTEDGGGRTSFAPWQPEYGAYQTSSDTKGDHVWENINGIDYNNSDFTNGYTAGRSSANPYDAAGADVGSTYLSLSRAGTRDSARNSAFYNYVYNNVYGRQTYSTDEPRSDKPVNYSPCRFYWREDPDKEIYSIKRVYYARHSRNYGYSTGYSLGMNRRLRIFCYLDKPHGSGPSGWAPFYHPDVNPSGAIDAGTGYAQPTHNGVDVDEFRTMVILDNVIVGTAAHEVKNPAVFETSPRDSQDIDIYYESGGAIPISIDGLDPTTFTPYIYVNSRVEIDYIPSGSSDTVTGEYYIGVIDKDGRLGLNNNTVTGMTAGDSVRIYKKDSDDSQYISSTLRYDATSAYTSIYLSDTTGHGGWCGIPFVNCINFQNGVESNTIKDLFNESKMSQGVVVSTTLDTVPKEETYEHGLIHSGIYNSKTGLNDFNQFIVADKITKDINPKYGSIQKLNTRDADMTVLCEDKIVRLLVNKNSLYNADGTTNVTASDLVLGQDVPYVGEYGISKNPESFVNYGYKSYFTDRNRGAILRLSQDGLTTISKNGMESYFDKNLRGEGFLIGSYDAKKYEYNITLSLPKIVIKSVSNTQYTRNIIMDSIVGLAVGMYVDGDNVQSGSKIVSINSSTNTIELNKDTLNNVNSIDLNFNEKATISFNDVSNGWSSFRSFILEQGLSVRGEYFTYSNGALYQHYVNDKANYFYGTPYSSSITAVFNDGPESVKDFKVLEYLGSIPKNKPSHYGWFISSAITDVETGYVGSFVEKEGKYIGYLKGFNTGYTDPKQFTTQGIGNITKFENA